MAALALLALEALEKFEALHCDPHRRPLLWNSDVRIDIASPSEQERATALAVQLVRECWRFRKQRCDGTQLPLLALAQNCGASETQATDLFQRNRPNFEATAVCRRMLANLLGIDAARSNGLDGVSPEIETAQRIVEFFFGREHADPNHSAKTYFDPQFRSASRPINFHEALCLYHYFRYFKREHPDREVSIVLVSGHHGFTAGDDRETSALAFRRALRDCARAGVNVLLIVPGTRNKQKQTTKSVMSPAYRSAVAVRTNLQREGPIPSTFRFLQVDPACEFEASRTRSAGASDPQRNRHAAEYLNTPFRYASFTTHNAGPSSPIDRQDLLVLRPSLGSQLLQSSFDASKEEREWFNEWLRAAIGRADDLPNTRVTK